jgi:membrane-associated protease RseP (regulator of RpoE activity)
MNRILATGAALLTLIGAVPANAAHKHTTRDPRAPVQQQWIGAGALIDDVDSNSPAARAGMRPGDRIVGINGSPINSQNDVDPFLAQGGRAITIDVKRDGAVVRLRATPQHGMLGYSYTKYPFCPGGNYCGSSDPQPPPYIPDPPIPTPPYIPPPVSNN